MTGPKASRNDTHTHTKEHRHYYPEQVRIGPNTAQSITHTVLFHSGTHTIDGDKMFNQSPMSGAGKETFQGINSIRKYIHIL